MRGSAMRDLFFVTAGKLSVYDGNMQLVDLIVEQELFGFAKFAEYFHLKYSLQLDLLVAEVESARTDEHADAHLD